MGMTEEGRRLDEAQKRLKHWRHWGPYLSERQWGTVREDYSMDGSAWDYFPHDHARSRAYRWGEDGMLGISDNHQRLCFALALWNGKDPILKERLFGLSNREGNHGEDVKEYYFYLDNTPTHSYMKALYRYPQSEFPYQQLMAENSRRGLKDPEFELLDTGIFAEDRFFDLRVEYAKADVSDILIRIEATNQGPEAALLHVLPTLWFRNTWSWQAHQSKPCISIFTGTGGAAVLKAEHPALGTLWLGAESPAAILFTENETNRRRLYGDLSTPPYAKDAFHDYVVNGNAASVNPAGTGTKAALHYHRLLAPGESWTMRLRLSHQPTAAVWFGAEFEAILAARKDEADDFYQSLSAATENEDARRIQRLSFAGLLWGKQFYHYVMTDWLKGDPLGPMPPASRFWGRNREWDHIHSDDVLSMPDKWEYPWFASWDLAFHCIPLAMIDPDFAKKQLLLLTREWYMHPNGQLPAYEWNFNDVNPPVHAWAAWRIYKIERKMYGRSDRSFLERVFQKLLLNFTWWVNRHDLEGRNVFQGGFLGLDNIAVFDRSRELPGGGRLEQSDATSWMAMYCLNLLAIAIELALENPSYEDIACKFLEHFLRIANAMHHVGERNLSLWNEEDGFFYDTLHFPGGDHIPLKVRSIVGLIPLFAVETLELSDMLKLPDFSRRVAWFIAHRPDIARDVTCDGVGGVCARRVLSIVKPDQLRRILKRMLSEREFLSPYGIRALSRYHEDHPYVLRLNDTEYIVDYEPAESTTGLFGGNSNWRGPVWMPVNFLMIESLQKFHHYLGNEFTVEFPTGSGRTLTLWEVSQELSRRLICLFEKDRQGRRPIYSNCKEFQANPKWSDLLLFFEYFNPETGTGLGASHQTGWTALIAKLIQQREEYHGRGPESSQSDPGEKPGLG